MPSHSQQKEQQAGEAKASIDCQQSVVRADTKSNQRIQIDCTVHCFHMNMFVSYVFRVLICFIYVCVVAVAQFVIASIKILF